MIKTKQQEDIRNLLDLTAPIPANVAKTLVTGPLHPESINRPRHVQGCACIECWNAGLRYGEWLQQKRLDEL